MTRPPIQPPVRKRKSMSEIRSSLTGSSFRRVYRDGRMTYSRRIMTLGLLVARSPSTRPRP